MDNKVNPVVIRDVEEAHARIRPMIRRTPILTSSVLNEMAGAELFFKCENFQKTGAFKARGAANAVLSLSDEEASCGVATHSSGNHAAALAWAARRRGITATVVMPRTASPVKIASVERYGGRIVFCEPTHRAREETAERIVRETGATLVHPYNDTRVIAGQATVALELLEDEPGLDMIICPVGGGGLLAGTCVVARSRERPVRVFAGEPEGAADVFNSLASGVRRPVEKPLSVADGLLAFVGDITFPIIQRSVEGVATVTDAEIVAAVRRLLGILKVAVEPSGAVGYAALSTGRIPIAGLKAGVILSGGNLDLERVLG